MKINTKFLEKKNKWSAFTTYRGMDMYEIANDEVTAIINLLNRLR